MVSAPLSWDNTSIEQLKTCPKTMTNGPCGGVGMDGSCEVDRGMICVWFEVLKRASTPETYTRGKPINWAEGSMWEAAFGSSDEADLHSLIDALPHRAKRPLRTGSRFESLLRDGHFAVTCELNPRDSADIMDFSDYARTLSDTVDAAHISDNSLSSPHMSGLACAIQAQQVGLETIMHMTCRDRNRLMLQADLLGAHAFGVRNVLCITGDHPALGDHYMARPVFDLDSITFIEMVDTLRSKGTFFSGRPLDVAPDVFVGGAVGVTAPPLDFRPYRMLKKLAAGADFIVTQLTFDLTMLKDFMQRVRDMGLHEKTYILIGMGALSTPNLARGINRNTPGVVIPDAIIKRLEGVPPAQRKAEGIQIVVEQIQQVMEIPGVSGIDLMDLEPKTWFPTVKIVERAGLADRPRLSS